MRDDYKTFIDHKIQVFGVNQADAESHNAFIKNQKYTFPLIVDSGFALSKAFGAWKDGDAYITRTVALVGADGKFIYYVRGLPADSEILAAYEAATKPAVAGSTPSKSDCKCGGGCACGGNPCKCGA